MRSTELVELAMRRLGIDQNEDQNAELARHLGLTGYNAPQKVRRWRKGDNEPDYKATLLLLKAAGLLAPETGAVKALEAGGLEEIPAADLPELAVAEAEALVRILRRLAAHMLPQSDGRAEGR